MGELNIDSICLLLRKDTLRVLRMEGIILDSSPQVDNDFLNIFTNYIVLSNLASR